MHFYPKNYAPHVALLILLEALKNLPVIFKLFMSEIVCVELTINLCVFWVRISLDFKL